MTNFLRYTYLSLRRLCHTGHHPADRVRSHAADVKPSAETKDGTRQIVVEANTSKTPGASPAAEKPAEIKPVADGPADASAKSPPPAPEAPAAEAAPQPRRARGRAACSQGPYQHSGLWLCRLCPPAPLRLRAQLWSRLWIRPQRRLRLRLQPLAPATTTATDSEPLK